jgi:NADH-quinone oxidoreductase subunit H
MGLAIVAIVMLSGELSLNKIVLQQANEGWNILKQPLGFLIYLVCAFAECNRAPFDLPETESELVGGYHTEYTSMKLGFFLFAEYINMFISSALIVCLFFGGYHLPFISSLDIHPNWLALIHFGVFMGKTIFFIFFYMWVRWTLPRFRFDQLMNLGWKALLPLALFNVILTAGVMYLLGKV